MASTISSSTTTIPPSWLSDNTNSTALRDASFSSYLDPTEEKYIRTLVTTIRHPPRPPKLVTDDEIDVFRADKYFNGVVGQEIPANNVTSTYHRHEKNIVTSLSKLNIQPRTPSIHSESSWNSRSALVRPMFKSPARGKNNSRVKKSLFFSSCYCCDDKSVDINDDQDQFSNQGNETFSSEFERGIATRTIKTSFDTSDIARFNKKRIDSYNTTEPFTFPVSSGPTSGTHNDTESDASSDLFEIDCLSSTANSAVGPTGYEPSEASVDWSVVTASAADFSVVSDFDEQGSTLTSVTRGRVGPTPKSSMNDGGQKSRTAGGMMIGGCKSQKAVRVAENVYMSSNNNGNRKSGECQRILRFSDSYSSVTKFRTEDKLTVHGLRPSRRISGSDFLYT